MGSSVVVPLGDGVRLHLVGARGFKTEVACLLLRRGLSRGEATVNALVPRILARGCAKYPSASRILAATEMMYGAGFDAGIVKKGEEQIVQLQLEYPPKRPRRDGVCLGEALGFLAEVALGPMVQDGSFVPNIVRMEKDGLLSSIMARMNEPGEYARMRLIQEAFAGEAFGIPGDGFAEDVGRISEVAAFAQYKDILEGSEVEIVVLTGAGAEDCEAAARACFGELLERRAVRAVPALGASSHPAGLPRTVREEADTNQGRLAMAYKGAFGSGMDDFCAMLLLSEVLGGAPGSRLFCSVREERSLAYYIGSSVYRFKGFIMVEAGVGPDNFEEVVELVDADVRSLSDPANISAGEMDVAKRSLTKKLEGIWDSQGSVLDFCVTQHILADTSTPHHIAQVVRSLTPEHIAATASRLRLDTVFQLGRG